MLASIAKRLGMYAPTSPRRGDAKVARASATLNAAKGKLSSASDHPPVAMGAHGVRTTSSADLPELIAGALDADGPTLIHLDIR